MGATTSTGQLRNMPPLVEGGKDAAEMTQEIGKYVSIVPATGWWAIYVYKGDASVGAEPVAVWAVERSERPGHCDLVVGLVAAAGEGTLSDAAEMSNFAGYVYSSDADPSDDGEELTEAGWKVQRRTVELVQLWQEVQNTIDIDGRKVADAIQRGRQ